MHRGLVIRGRWGDDVRGEYLVDADTLERIAQEIDDLEIMSVTTAAHCCLRYALHHSCYAKY